MGEMPGSSNPADAIRQVPIRFSRGLWNLLLRCVQTCEASAARGYEEARGGAAVMARSELPQCGRWRKAFDRECKDHRYYEIVEDSMHCELQYRYLALKDEDGEVCAIQPFFIIEQDLVLGTSHAVRACVGFVRRFWPRFFTMRTLMVGCLAGEGQLDAADGIARRFCASLLPSAIIREAQKQKARLIVMKEFPASYRKALACFLRLGFVRLPSLPMTSLNIDYPTFDEYMMRALSHATRKDLRRKFRAATRGAPIEMTVLTDVSSIIDEIYPLYAQVYQRSDRHFEKLTKPYLCQLGQRMPDKMRFFVWRQSGHVIAFSMCMVQGECIYDEYIGLDYAVALDLHLYHYTFRDIVTWAMANGYKWYRSRVLNYDPKLHLRCRLDPLDLYVRHSSDLINWCFKVMIPLIEPTRYDKNLRRFSNYADLWSTE
jgi:predicted N-acyltransferase